MSTQLFPVSNVFNQCATCGYWMAPRTLNAGFFRRSVAVEGDGVTGRCANESSLFGGHQRPGSAGCSQWAKWEQID